MQFLKYNRKNAKETLFRYILIYRMVLEIAFHGKTPHQAWNTEINCISLLVEKNWRGRD